jgi:hypothetical protein
MFITLVRWILGALGIVLFYIGVTMTKDSQGEPDNWLERKSKQIRTRGEGVLQLQTAFLRGVCERFADWFQRRRYGPGFFRLSVTICAIPNALVFLFIPRLWEPSIGTKIVFVILFLWCAADGSSFMMMLISSFPFIFRWWAWFQPFDAIKSGVMTHSDLVSAVEMLVVEVLVVIGVFLGGALVIVLLLGVTRLLAGSAQKSKVPLVYLSLLLPVNGIVASLSLLPLLRPDLVFPTTWLSLDPENLMRFIVVQAVSLFSLLAVLPALAAMAIALLMLIPLIHVIIWPLLWKPLQQLNRKLLDTPGLFISGGMASIGVAWPGSAVLKVLEHIHPWL